MTTPENTQIQIENPVFAGNAGPWRMSVAPMLDWTDKLKSPSKNKCLGFFLLGL